MLIVRVNTVFGKALHKCVLAVLAVTVNMIYAAFLLLICKKMHYRFVYP